jgi:hypothetical protein
METLVPLEFVLGTRPCNATTIFEIRARPSHARSLALQHWKTNTKGVNFTFQFNNNFEEQRASFDSGSRARLLD